MTNSTMDAFSKLMSINNDTSLQQQCMENADTIKQLQQQIEQLKSENAQKDRDVQALQAKKTADQDEPELAQLKTKLAHYEEHYSSHTTQLGMIKSEARGLFAGVLLQQDRLKKLVGIAQIIANWEVAYNPATFIEDVRKVKQLLLEISETQYLNSIIRRWPSTVTGEQFDLLDIKTLVCELREEGFLEESRRREHRLADIWQIQMDEIYNRLTKVPQEHPENFFVASDNSTLDVNNVAKEDHAWLLNTHTEVRNLFQSAPTFDVQTGNLISADGSVSIRLRTIPDCKDKSGASSARLSPESSGRDIAGPSGNLRKVTEPAVQQPRSLPENPPSATPRAYGRRDASRPAKAEPVAKPERQTDSAASTSATAQGRTAIPPSSKPAPNPRHDTLFDTSSNTSRATTPRMQAQPGQSQQQKEIESLAMPGKRPGSPMANSRAPKKLPSSTVSWPQPARSGPLQGLSGFARNATHQRAGSGSSFGRRSISSFQSEGGLDTSKQESLDNNVHLQGLMQQVTAHQPDSSATSGISNDKSMMRADGLSKDGLTSSPPGTPVMQAASRIPATSSTLSSPSIRSNLRSVSSTPPARLGNSSFLAMLARSSPSPPPEMLKSILEIDSDSEDDMPIPPPANPAKKATAEPETDSTEKPLN